ncbi:ATP-binding protein [Kitasatospora sp. MBT63]|uniref:ATP-binding protein n=1 Tax=Kitasatospora sp. MBT63 TaxID=1444768 RepID=UPI00068B4B05|nr:ATP-binding protein [Kitasatospora sp. MBT63]
MDDTARHWSLPLTPADGSGNGLHRGIELARHALEDTGVVVTFEAPGAAGEPGVPEERAQDILLVVSELLSNAYRHTPGPTGLDIRLDRERGKLTVAVTDTGTRRPVVRAYRPTQPHGHGMHIVDRLAASWGVTPAPGGKTVWAVLPAP